MKRITILHVFPDDKFFDGTAEFYDSLPNVENLYYYYTRVKPHFKYIKSLSKVVVIRNLYNYLKLFSSNDVDFVLFYRLPTIYYFLFFFIGAKQKVIWWSWGWDIYSNTKYLKPLVNINLYKPLTREQVVITNKISLWRTLYIKPISLLLNHLRKNAIKRVDYFIPSATIDYDLMKEKSDFFRAKYFPYGILPPKTDLRSEHKEKVGNLLIGNSLTYSNNHLDVFEKIYPLSFHHDRTIFIPVSYGDAFGGVSNLISMTHFKDKNIVWLKDYLKKDEYFKILNSVTHAVFGIMRQQALGNILYCLRTGVKVYLYKDSVLTKQLKKCGYIIYTIEEDLNDYSLSTVLSSEGALHNYHIYMMRFQERSIESVMAEFEKAMM